MNCLFYKWEDNACPQQGYPEFYPGRSCSLCRKRQVAMWSRSADPVLPWRAQPRGLSIMGCGQLFGLSGFVKNSWLQSCHMPGPGQDMCSEKGPGALTPPQRQPLPHGFTDSNSPRSLTSRISLPWFASSLARLPDLWESLVHRLWLRGCMEWRHFLGLSSVLRACVLSHLHTFKLRASWLFFLCEPDMVMDSFYGTFLTVWLIYSTVIPERGTKCGNSTDVVA